MNEVLLFVEVGIVFSLVVMFKKYLGLAGLFVWIGIASIIANIEVIKSVEVFGISATLGNVLFASNFLATDMISESYGRKEANKGVVIGLFSVVAFLVCSQLALLFTPSEIDIAHGAMKELFGLSPRVCFASLFMFVIANFADVYLYNKLKAMFKGKKMWLRNNISTILCNCAENFGFTWLAFYGVYEVKDLFSIALATCVIEIIIALCDTPFLYWSKKVKSPESEIVGTI